MHFKRIYKIEAAVIKEIGILDEKELALLIGECERMTDTNCSWIGYGLRKIATEMARAQIHTLKIRKKQGLKAEKK